MADTVSAVRIQDEEDESKLSVVECQDDITINGIVGLNADGSSINPEGE